MDRIQLFPVRSYLRWIMILTLEFIVLYEKKRMTPLLRRIIRTCSILVIFVFLFIDQITELSLAFLALRMHVIRLEMFFIII